MNTIPITSFLLDIDIDECTDWFQLGMLAIIVGDPIFTFFYDDFQFQNVQIYQNYIDYNLYFRCTSNTREDSISQWDHSS